MTSSSRISMMWNHIGWPNGSDDLMIWVVWCGLPYDISRISYHIFKSLPRNIATIHPVLVHRLSIPFNQHCQRRRGSPGPAPRCCTTSVSPSWRPAGLPIHEAVPTDVRSANLGTLGRWKMTVGPSSWLLDRLEKTILDHATTIYSL